MRGYYNFLGDFLQEQDASIIEQIITSCPDADQSQVNSWHRLIQDVKSCPTVDKLPKSLTIAIEYSLPISGMAIDLMICGRDNKGHPLAFIIESKQWFDHEIDQMTYSEYREDVRELHPQVQVSRHWNAFRYYTDVGIGFDAVPYVFAPNATPLGLQKIKEKCPNTAAARIECHNFMQVILERIKAAVILGDQGILDALSQAEYKPSKAIIDAMQSIVTHDDPFILTDEQLKAVNRIEESIQSGKRIIRITGPAGSGKTAILLNLYVQTLRNMDRTGLRPIFISGAQNTALYKSLFPQVDQSFVYSFSLDKMVAKTKGSIYRIFMDEAQHNSPGIIRKMLERNATVILCYDSNQAISASNALQELREFEKRNDFESISLDSFIRFNGSQVFENNVKRLLSGSKSFSVDDSYDFKVFDTLTDFQKQIFETCRKHPDRTVAVTGLLSNDATTITGQPESRLFTQWTYKSECQWIPYVNQRNYLSKNEGKMWVGTWWMPGLDADYVAVIIGGDAVLTKDGLHGVPDSSKLYPMMISIAQELGLPDDLIVKKISFGKEKVDTYRTSKRIISHIDEPANRLIKAKYHALFSTYLKNNYYIMLTRGRLGCYVYFVNDETRKEH